MKSDTPLTQPQFYLIFSQDKGQMLQKYDVLSSLVGVWGVRDGFTRQVTGVLAGRISRLGNQGELMARGGQRSSCQTQE